MSTIRKDFVTLSKSPNQTTDEFDLFLLNLEKVIVDISSRNTHFLLITGDFNGKSRNWSTNDTTAGEGAHLDSLITLYGLNQLIKEPTHVLEHTSSCIDLISTNQANLIRDPGIHPTLHSKCHYQNILSKLNLKTEYYSRAETDLINRSSESLIGRSCS